MVSYGIFCYGLGGEGGLTSETKQGKCPNSVFTRGTRTQGGDISIPNSDMF